MTRFDSYYNFIAYYNTLVKDEYQKDAQCKKSKSDLLDSFLLIQETEVSGERFFWISSYKTKSGRAERFRLEDFNSDADEFVCSYSPQYNFDEAVTIKSTLLGLTIEIAYVATPVYADIDADDWSESDNPETPISYTYDYKAKVLDKIGTDGGRFNNWQGCGVTRQHAVADLYASIAQRLSNDDVMTQVYNVDN